MPRLSLGSPGSNPVGSGHLSGLQGGGVPAETDDPRLEGREELRRLGPQSRMPEVTLHDQVHPRIEVAAHGEGGAVRDESLMLDRGELGAVSWEPQPEAIGLEEQVQLGEDLEQLPPERCLAG